MSPKLNHGISYLAEVSNHFWTMNFGAMGFSQKPLFSLHFWLILCGVVAVLAIMGVTWLPYSALAVIAMVPAALLLIGYPDWGFALFFAVETLFSEDVLLATEQLEKTIYLTSLPYIGLNCFELALVILIGLTLLQRRGVILGTPLDTSIFLFLIASLAGYITCLVLYHDPVRLYEPRRILHFLAGYFLFVNLIRTKESLKIFVVLFFIACCLKSLQGLYLYTGGEGLLIKWKTRAIFTGWGDSLCFVTYLLLLGTIWVDQVSFPGKRWFLFLAPIVFFSFLFSYKRAYYMAIVTGTATLFWLQGRKSRFRFIGIALSGFIIILAIIALTGQWHAMSMRLESILHPTEESSANYRLVEWRNAMISIRNHPWFGIGLGGVMPMEIWLSRTNLLGVHNTFLWIAVKMGVFGLFSLLLIHVAFLRHLVQQNERLRDPFLRSVSRGLTCVFIAFITAEMFAPMFTQMRTATWMGIILGLGMMLREMDSSKSIPVKKNLDIDKV